MRILYIYTRETTRKAPRSHVRARYAHTYGGLGEFCNFVTNAPKRGLTR